MDNPREDIEPIAYELYPFVTGAERLAVLEDIRKAFTHKRAQQLLAELEQIKGEYDRPIAPIS